MPILYTRGSEWRKWDLHIHSDASPDSNLTPETIVDNMIENGINVFSVTDHSCVENVDKFWELIKQKNEIGENIYFLPGIELKTDKGDKSVHITGIFPEYDLKGHLITSKYLEENFLSQIGCTESKLIDMGKQKLKVNKTNDEFKKRGKLEFTVLFEKASEKIKKIGGVCIVHAGSKSNSIEEEMEHEESDKEDDLLNSLGHLKEELMINYIDICELSNWNESKLKQRDFYLNKFKKPSIVSSDSHEIRRLGTKFTWIKADPTFEGLRQIIYEPEERVRIQEQKPDEKTSYLIIDKVRFLDKSTKQKFSDKWIKLNPNLNGIIGGKSSGKSLLLYHIAKTIDPNQVENRIKGLLVPQYNFNEDEFDFEVHWKDGEIHKLSNGVESKNRRITYLPQMYINNLAEKEAEKSLNKQILEILIQNKTFKEFYEMKMDIAKEKNEAVSHEIITLFGLLEELSYEKDELKKIGDESAIITEISNIKSKIDDLRAKSGFSDEDNINYIELFETKDLKEKEISRIQTIKESLEPFQKYFIKLENEFVYNISTEIEKYKEKHGDDQETVKVFDNVETSLIVLLKRSIEKTFEDNNELIS